MSVRVNQMYSLSTSTTRNKHSRTPTNATAPPQPAAAAAAEQQQSSSSQHAKQKKNLELPAEVLYVEREGCQGTRPSEEIPLLQAVEGPEAIQAVRLVHGLGEALAVFSHKKRNKMGSDRMVYSYVHMCKERERKAQKKKGR